MTFADDAGEYSIFVKNPHGEVSASASLLEEGREGRSSVAGGWSSVALSTCPPVFPEQYEAYVRQLELTVKTEVTTTVIREPSVMISQVEQKQISVPVSVVMEKVCPSGRAGASVARTRLSDTRDLVSLAGVSHFSL